jgi:SAM-dependent MidA family methyltransferase
MASGNSQLIQIIRAEISARGPISFARFMQLALYEPSHGYYASGRAQIGRHGDFFTNVSIGPTFGRLLAAQFAEVWEKLKRPATFLILEHGAHDGAFAADTLSALERSLPECYAAIHYVIAEPFPVWREQQRERLARFCGKIRWVESMKELEPFVGIHFSNELFDALPVHLVVSGGVRDGTIAWNEQLVSVAGDNFEFVAVPLDNHDLQARLDRLGSFPAGFQTEVSLAAPALVSDIAAKLTRGVVLTIDYGFPRPEFYSYSRHEGSLQIRTRHRKLSSAFEEIGRADISAHVEWTSLAEAGESAGAGPLGFTDQHHFFTGILSQSSIEEGFEESQRRALQTLLHPEMLGRSFQVLALGKDFSETISGFRFARHARTQLGI